MHRTTNLILFAGKCKSERSGDVCLYSQSFENRIHAYEVFIVQKKAERHINGRIVEVREDRSDLQMLGDKLLIQKSSLPKLCVVSRWKRIFLECFQIRIVRRHTAISQLLIVAHPKIGIVIKRKAP